MSKIKTGPQAKTFVSADFFHGSYILYWSDIDKIVVHIMYIEKV